MPSARNPNPQNRNSQAPLSHAGRAAIMGRNSEEENVIISKRLLIMVTMIVDSELCEHEYSA